MTPRTKNQSPLIALLETGLAYGSLKEPSMNIANAIEFSNAKLAGVNISEQLITKIHSEGHQQKIRHLSIYVSPKVEVYDADELLRFVVGLKSKLTNLGTEYKISYPYNPGQVHPVHRDDVADMELGIHKLEYSNSPSPYTLNSISIFVFPDEKLARYAAENADEYGRADSSKLGLVTLKGVSAGFDAYVLPAV